MQTAILIALPIIIFIVHLVINEKQKMDDLRELHDFMGRLSFKSNRDPKEDEFSFSGQLEGIPMAVETYEIKEG